MSLQHQKYPQLYSSGNNHLYDNVAGALGAGYETGAPQLNEFDFGPSFGALVDPFYTSSLSSASHFPTTLTFVPPLPALQQTSYTHTQDLTSFNYGGHYGAVDSACPLHAAGNPAARLVCPPNLVNASAHPGYLRKDTSWGQDHLPLNQPPTSHLQISTSPPAYPPPAHSAHSPVTLPSTQYPVAGPSTDATGLAKQQRIGTSVLLQAPLPHPAATCINPRVLDMPAALPSTSAPPRAHQTSLGMADQGSSSGLDMYGIDPLATIGRAHNLAPPRSLQGNNPLSVDGKEERVHMDAVQAAQYRALQAESEKFASMPGSWSMPLSSPSLSATRNTSTGSVAPDHELPSRPSKKRKAEEQVDQRRSKRPHGQDPIDEALTAQVSPIVPGRMATPYLSMGIVSASINSSAIDSVFQTPLPVESNTRSSQNQESLQDPFTIAESCSASSQGWASSGAQPTPQIESVEMEQEEHLSPHAVQQSSTRRSTKPKKKATRKTKNKKAVCPACHETYNRLHDVHRHLESISNDVHREFRETHPEYQVDFPCPFKGCEKSFPRKDGVTRHFKTHFRTRGKQRR